MRRRSNYWGTLNLLGEQYVMPRSMTAINDVWHSQGRNEGSLNCGWKMGKETTNLETRRTCAWGNRTDNKDYSELKFKMISYWERREWNDFYKTDCGKETWSGEQAQLEILKMGRAIVEMENSVEGSFWRVNAANKGGVSWNIEMVHHMSISEKSLSELTKWSLQVPASQHLHISHLHSAAVLGIC